MKMCVFIKKSLIQVLMTLIIFLSFTACSNNSGSNGSSPGPEGRFDCTHYEDYEKGLQPIDKEDIYEHLSFNADGSGLWEFGVDSAITWKLKGDKITIVEPVGDSKNTFYGIWDGDKITLDVLGYERIFEKEEVKSPSTRQAATDAASNDMSWALAPAGSIQIPSLWYGVAIFKNCVGFDFDKVRYDVWGFIEEDSSGKVSFKLYLDPEASGYPILSMYINQEETAWLTPVIGKNDAWLLVDPDSGNQQNLVEEDYWTILAQYKEGALDIVHDYYDGENSQYAKGRLFIRELGTAWNEMADPLPPGYDDYKKEFSSRGKTPDDNKDD